MLEDADGRRSALATLYAGLFLLLLHQSGMELGLPWHGIMDTRLCTVLHGQAVQRDLAELRSGASCSCTSSATPIHSGGMRLTTAIASTMWKWPTTK